MMNGHIGRGGCLLSVQKWFGFLRGEGGTSEVSLIKGH